MSGIILDVHGAASLVCSNGSKVERDGTSADGKLLWGQSSETSVYAHRSCRVYISLIQVTIFPDYSPTGSLEMIEEISFPEAVMVTDPIFD
jgi:hypothetical protein